MAEQLSEFNFNVKNRYGSKYEWAYKFMDGNIWQIKRNADFSLDGSMQIVRNRLQQIAWHKGLSIRTKIMDEDTIVLSTKPKEKA